MKKALSPRLLNCCQFVHPGDRIADIGCDHGYLTIHLLSEGIASHAIAADINEGPLSSAVANSRKAGLSQKISFHLSDGLKNIPRDFDCLICAGMGAETMIAILDAAPWIHCEPYRMVMQCQTRTYMLRKYLSDRQWEIEDETIVRDGRFLYTAMSVSRNFTAPLSPGQCYLSPALLRHNGRELQEYCCRIRQGLVQAVEGKGAEAVPFMAQALRELDAEPCYHILRSKL